jgi:enoyl-[acyl-carrier protein] reductase III
MRGTLEVASMAERQETLLSGWAVILGASSGFGGATAVAMARAGMNVIGVHLDRKNTAHLADEVQAKVRAFGREALFFNVNAADAERRKEVLDTVAARLKELGQSGEVVRVLMHSLAFGALKPMVGEDQLTSSQLEMTLDVMANSVVYWAQDLVNRKMFGKNGRIYAMTSAGSSRVWPIYGAVSAAKAALEAHMRQLAYELAPLGITANSVRAGVTDTPALRKIPGNQDMIDVALRKNPHHRLTTAEDVASALVALTRPETYWLSGNVLNIDGCEEIGS